MHDSNTRYVPSDALRALVLAQLRDEFPELRKVYAQEPLAPDVLDFVNTHIARHVRGLIATEGLGLDADNKETYVMTEGGVLKDEVAKFYLFRFRVSPGDAAALVTEITKDLYRYAGQSAMQLASARLEVQDGELVIVGLESKRKPASAGRVRATISPLG